MRYPKDLIEENNKKTKMKRSVVKFWNVLYGQPEVVGAPDAPEDSGTQEKIEEILQEKETNLKKLIAREKRGTETPETAKGADAAGEEVETAAAEETAEAAAAEESGETKDS